MTIYEVSYHITVLISLGVCSTHQTLSSPVAVHSFPVHQALVFICQLFHPPLALKQTDMCTAEQWRSTALLTACKSWHISGAPFLTHDEAGQASS